MLDLPVHGDSRGRFKENWRRAKQTALGLRDLGLMWNSISFSAEPWDKRISVATGSAFGAWVDLRPGKSLGGCSPVPSTRPKHCIVRSSWAIGDGCNFVKTMVDFSNRIAAGEITQVTIADDRVGRLSFTRDMVEGVFWLLGYREGGMEPSKPAPYGAHNLTGSGQPKSWADVAKRVFGLTNGNGEKVVPVAAAEYYASVQGLTSSCPEHSAMDLSKIQATSPNSLGWEQGLNEYDKGELVG